MKLALPRADGEFGAAAPDVHQDGFSARSDALKHAGPCKTGFLAGIDDLDPDAGLARSLDELIFIGCLPQAGGCTGAITGDPQPVHFGSEEAQRVDRVAEFGLADRAGRRQRPAHGRDPPKS